MSTGKHEVIFYPVGNGDTSQIVLSSGRRVLLDYRHQSCGEGKNHPVIDLAKRLRSELKDANRDYFDVVAFTHADSDHICGFSKFFELHHAACYQGGDRIKISELWVPAGVLVESATHEERSDEFYLLRQEARHRLKAGLAIKVFSKPDEIKKMLKEWDLEDKRDECFVDAGTLVPGFTLTDDGVEFFVHSPFAAHCDGKEFIRNTASLVFNVRFNASGFQCDYLAVGDTEYETLGQIVEKTEKHKNHDRLDWNLYNIPHHCSYKALGQEKGDKETTPDEPVRRLLEHGKPGSYIVSSSNPIPDSRDAYQQVQPPHRQARNTYDKYRKQVGGRKFLVTMEEPNASYPEPIIFEITSKGLSLKETAAAAVAGASILSSPAPRAG